MNASIPVHATLCALLLALVAAPASAQKYPTKPIRMLVGFPMGGGADIAAVTLVTFPVECRPARDAGE